MYIYIHEYEEYFYTKFSTLAAIESDGRSLYIHAQIVLSVSHVFYALKGMVVVVCFLSDIRKSITSESF